MIIKCGPGNKPCGKRCIPQEYNCAEDDLEPLVELDKEPDQERNERIERNRAERMVDYKPRAAFDSPVTIPGSLKGLTREILDLSTTDMAEMGVNANDRDMMGHEAADTVDMILEQSIIALSQGGGRGGANIYIDGANEDVMLDLADHPKFAYLFGTEPTFFRDGRRLGMNIDYAGPGATPEDFDQDVVPDYAPPKKRRKLFGIF
jgi:hypothetical protein